MYLKTILLYCLLLCCPALQAQHKRPKVEIGGRYLFPNGILKNNNDGGLGASLTLTKLFKKTPALCWNVQAGVERFMDITIYYGLALSFDIPTIPNPVFVHLSGGLRYYIIPRIYVQQNLGLAYTDYPRNGLCAGWQTTVGLMPLRRLAVQASAFGFKTSNEHLSSFAAGLAFRL